RAGEHARVRVGSLPAPARARQRARAGGGGRGEDRVRGPSGGGECAARRARARDARGRTRAVRHAGLHAARAAGVGGGGRRARHLPPGACPVSGLDPIELRVITGALHAACEEMGVVLIRSAHSANIKERRDASTALFNTAGEMIMQAEHIPVHLGAMPAAVSAVLGERHAPGTSWILNDPFAGGTPLPDITVITPVFMGAGTPLGFAA